MGRWFRKISLCFAAGSMGGLVNSLALWLFGLYGLNSILDVAIAPRLTPGWLYPRVVWGGIWGALFLLPLVKSRYLLRGLIVSLGPTLVQLGYIFPHIAHQGMLGLKLGTLTPVLVMIVNALWGMTAALWLRLVDRSV
ncbi:MAG: hypothetical protein PVJ53_05940 [Desulfobacterales bacterium]|jgi:hypothetical protein